MATQYGKGTDVAADPSQDPGELVTAADAVVGVTATQLGISTPGSAGDVHGATVGGSVATPDFGIAGALLVVDDATYTDPADGTVVAGVRYWPGTYQAQVYQNEKTQAIGNVTENPNLNVQSLEPVGVSADMALLDGT